MDRSLRKPPECKKEGISPAAFITTIVFMILLAILVIIIMILYFRKGANLIDPSKCPAAISGLVATPDTTINTVATNCGSQADCTYTVNSLEQAALLCSSLSGSKCAAFTLKQINNSNTYTMTISSATGKSALVGSDTYVPVA
uniref:Uncharacterized protein n=1 Tax=viral metagenome TaxID=1070528 RepID=A0A6C0CGW1_9ZZZZ